MPRYKLAERLTKRGGVYLSLVVALYEISMSFMFARWLSVSEITIQFALLVLLGAIIARFKFKVIGGLLVAAFSILWWYYSMAGPFVDFEGFLINLNSPLGAMTSIAPVLGVAAGVLNIAASVFKFLEKEKT